MTIKERITRYSQAFGPSGAEDHLITMFADDLKQLGIESYVDALGNVEAWLAPRDDAKPTVMITGHLDEIGYVIRKIDAEGFAYVNRVGGVNDRAAGGQRVRFLGTHGLVPGVVGVKAKHVSSPEEQRTVVPVEELYIDFFTNSAQETETLGIEVGSLGAYDEPLTVHGDKIAGKALDNRVSIAVLIELAERLHPIADSLDCNVVLLATVQEEFNVRGGESAARRINPDVGLCIDIAIATDTPDLRALGDIALGAGPVLTRYTRAGMNGIIPNPKLVQFCQRVAQVANINVQNGVLSGGLTDMSHMHHQGDGFPAIDISFAARYTHTPIEIVDVQDVTNLTTLVQEFCKIYSNKTSFARGA